MKKEAETQVLSLLMVCQNGQEQAVFCGRHWAEVMNREVQY